MYYLTGCADLSSELLLVLDEDYMYNDKLNVRWYVVDREFV
jgi:hypothetical protein